MFCSEPTSGFASQLIASLWTSFVAGSNTAAVVYSYSREIIVLVQYLSTTVRAITVLVAQSSNRFLENSCRYSAKSMDLAWYSVIIQRFMIHSMPFFDLGLCGRYTVQVLYSK